jgi:hypothetical protein
VVIDNVQPAGGVTENVTYFVESRLDAVGQLLELSEFTPATAVTPEARVTLLATTPGAMASTDDASWLPASPVKSHVASAPVNGIVQVTIGASMGGLSVGGLSVGAASRGAKKVGRLLPV